MKKNLGSICFVVGIVLLISLLSWYAFSPREFAQVGYSMTETPDLDFFYESEYNLIDDADYAHSGDEIRWSFPTAPDVVEDLRELPPLGYISEASGEDQEPYNVPEFFLTLDDSLHEEVPFSELEFLAGYIKYGTNFNTNFELFLENVQTYLRSSVFLPETLSSGNMKITNVLSGNPRQSFVVIDNLVDETSTLFSVRGQVGFSNRVDLVSIVQSMQFSSYKYLSSGEMIVLFRDSESVNFLLAAVSSVDGIPWLTSYLLLDTFVSVFEDGTDVIQAGVASYTIVVSDGVLSLLSSNGTLVFEGIINDIA